MRRSPSASAAGVDRAPADPAAPDTSVPDDLVAVGRVADSYGVSGWVKVVPFNSPQESVLRTARRWWLPDGRCVRIERARVHAATIVAKPAGSDDRDAALALKGLELRVRRADFPKVDDEYYWVDLVGCEVTNPGGDALGEVASVEDFGAHPILRLSDAAGVERMIPFVGAYIVEVDVAAKRIVADWLPDY